ncbi:hypothetical protein [Siphonobacter sp. SORGH_AS_0500]|uniref:hypothetical protein n=1 Tax=Siphonobacter sp. SORGH_AS_0500 TaxID=1864824 RepID=UPI0028549D34|nr:hypothetical protein [Siphonobacter sp. SORGH_AS_0500]MDR6195651.1 hypothetical protein [Siphonobacter sp. SORGH_AS_0500]
MVINIQNGQRIYVDLSDLHFPSFEEEKELNNGLVVDLIEIDGVYYEETPERRRLLIEKKKEAFLKQNEGRKSPFTLEFKMQFQFPYQPFITKMDGQP